MKGQKAKVKFLDTTENRIFVTLVLAVGYPLFCAAFFPLFLFLILPAAGLVSQMLPYLYWLSSAGNWVVLAALLLPQMRKKVVPTANMIMIDVCEGGGGGGGRKRETFSLLSEEEDEERRGRRRSSTKEKAELETPEKVSRMEEEKVEEEEEEEEESRVTVHQSQLDTSDEEVETRRVLLSCPPTKGEKNRSNERLSFRLRDESEEEEEEEEEVTKTVRSVRREEHCTTETELTKTVSHRVEETTTEAETKEYSLPSPLCVGGEDGTPNRNTVFIFVNNDEQH